MKQLLHWILGKRARRGMNATRMVALSFGGMILLGAALLTLPAMSADGESAGILSGLFTATSATCVTGLALRDTLTQWSLGGQVVILCMIQLGGLGFMTACTLILSVFRQDIDLSQRMVLASGMGLRHIGGVVRMVRHALVGTAVIEGIGALLLSFFFVPQHGLLRGVWYGVFHSISAFCNAGFDLMGPAGGGSLITAADRPLVLLIHGTLIVTGGLGFFVWEDIYRNRRWKKLSVYTRLVLGTTAFLILSGGLYFLAAEWSNPMTLGPMPWWDKVANSLFQSVSLRTAGFASIPRGGMYEHSQVMSLLYMLVGGSSGSTAGGIKTVTALVLAAALWSGLRGRRDVTIFRRRVREEQISDAFTLTLTVLLAVFVCAMTLSVLEEVPFLSLLFEVVSAIGTVGVSTGITSSLSPVSCLILIGLMYMGRVGILSFSLAFIIRRGKTDKVRYPTCDLMIG
ncbi:MAG: potassium transporter TrkG [Evtepia sp.]|uniref:TrkH family potassium uptake protein n=1 Tax=Evtepia sp. TaxID=2773933 RepID=UPI002A753129|nr:potassium transporter TrkG [Evtepia sp.]MDY3014964.1 potassium transporter TrkG [Evtepia sp.]